MRVLLRVPDYYSTLSDGRSEKPGRHTDVHFLNRRELAPLVDKAWRMHTGGRLEQAQWPLEPGSQRLELNQGVVRS